MQDFDFERYKSVDFSNAKPANLNPKIKQLQDNLKAEKSQNELTSFFDDVQEASHQYNSLDPKDLIKNPRRCQNR